MKNWLLILLLLAAPCAAHEVHHTIETTSAVTVHLVYADGKPYAYEAYELYPAGKDIPAQVGRTDAQGRVVFIPGDNRAWRLKAFSTDGHGTDLSFESPAVASSSSPVSQGPNRLSLILFGLSLLLAGFGLVQLLIRQRKTS
ncbi:hypothetical protein SCT_0376 [Sulfuricella sp. T08]|uniref:ABC transporter permease n=1 Tax=Sulfuricella sp. T08 TaxID=1632857 RepID=UPI00061798C1|nr:ABC transporter permease [Sulfuricella sp. T08]GAO34996.1 hypothetical protein SCT_0376 [Sulfuricella sp. T08]